VRLVVNADDFGYSHDTVRATIDAFERGDLTSASIMPNMPATDEALSYAREHPQFSFGVHLTFVGDGRERPASAPAAVPHLVDGAGRLESTNHVRLRAALRLIPLAEIEREVVAQVSVVQRAGVPVSHADSHRHLHKYAAFRTALERALPRLGVHRVRNVQDVFVRRRLVSPTTILGRRWRNDLMRSFITTDHFYMATSTGELSWDDVWPKLSQLEPAATLEVGAHPGYEEQWRNDERQALGAFVEQARALGHSLIPWHAIGLQADKR
jgi:predicted glycoside hydrolase/deacetylase ChbG (UPF0249 family)